MEFATNLLLELTSMKMSYYGLVTVMSLAAIIALKEQFRSLATAIWLSPILVLGTLLAIIFVNNFEFLDPFLLSETETVLIGAFGGLTMSYLLIMFGAVMFRRRGHHG